MTPIGKMHLDQHWLRQWLIIWTNVDFLLLRFCGIPLKAISQWVTRIISHIHVMSLQIIFLKSLPQLQGVNELLHHVLCQLMPSCRCASYHINHHIRAAEISVRFQSDQTIKHLYQIFRWDVFSGIEMVPMLYLLLSNSTSNCTKNRETALNSLWPSGSLQNKCWSLNPDWQNWGRSGKLSFFTIYIIFCKTVLRSRKFQILFWRL